MNFCKERTLRFCTAKCTEYRRCDFFKQPPLAWECDCANGSGLFVKLLQEEGFAVLSYHILCVSEGARIDFERSKNDERRVRKTKGDESASGSKVEGNRKMYRPFYW